MVDGLIEPMAQARPMIEAVYRSVLPLAVEWELTSHSESEAWLAALAGADDDATVRYPLLVGAARRKPY